MTVFFFVLLIVVAWGANRLSGGNAGAVEARLMIMRLSALADPPRAPRGELRHAVPFYWVLKTSISGENIFAYPPSMIPQEPHLFYYVDVWYCDSPSRAISSTA